MTAADHAARATEYLGKASFHEGGIDVRRDLATAQVYALLDIAAAIRALAPVELTPSPDQDARMTGITGGAAIADRREFVLDEAMTNLMRAARAHAVRDAASAVIDRLYGSGTIPPEHPLRYAVDILHGRADDIERGRA